MRYPLRIIAGVLPLILISGVCCAEAPAAPDATGTWPAAAEIFFLLLPVLVLFAGAFIYLRSLQRSYQQSSPDGSKLEILSRSPLGLPEGTVGAMLRLMTGILLVYIILVALITIQIRGFPSLSAPGGNGATGGLSGKDLLAGIGAVFFLLLVIIGAVFYMQRLQTRFFKGCVETRQIDQFFQAPAGLPQGTIRAVLAMMIVTVSLFFIVFKCFITKDSQPEIPQGLMTLLTAVVAFYFAHRAGIQGAAGEIAHQTQGLRNQRDAAVEEGQQIKAGVILGKVDKALQVTRAAGALLPPELRKKYEPLAEKLQTGLTAAKEVLGRGGSSEAARMVSGALGEFGRANPAFQAVQKALPVFTNELGTNISAMALITALVDVTVRIGSARYERWKQRIFQAPIDAGALKLQPMDGPMAERLFRANPVLAKAFATELKSGRSAELARVANDFINGDTQELWEKNTECRFEDGKERFESQEIFEQTVQALRRLLSDNELKPYIEPEWLGPISNYDTLVGAVDKLHEDETARARLDELVLVTDGLMREGQPVLKIMEKIEKELKGCTPWQPI